MLDFTASLFKMDEDTVRATGLFRELINLCDDFNVFMLDPNDTEHDNMRCVFVFYNVSHEETIFGKNKEEESELN